MYVFQLWILLVSILLTAKCATAQEATVTEMPVVTLPVIASNNASQPESTTIIPPLVEGESIPQLAANPVENAGTNLVDTVLPQNPTNEYMNPYGGQYYPGNYYYSSYPWLYPPSSYQPQTVYGPSAVEYQGVLVPVQMVSPSSVAVQGKQTKSTQKSSNKESRVESKNQPARNYDMAMLMQSLLAPNLLEHIVTWITFVLNSFNVMALFGVVASAMCMLTPVCPFPLRNLPTSIRKEFFGNLQIDDTAGTTVQRVRRTAEMVSNALEKYEKLQNDVNKIKKTFKAS